MTAIKKRLENLERHAAPKGELVVVSMINDDYTELTPEQRREKLAAVQQKAGPKGTVIQIVYTHDWRGEP